jgi:hypothetical protein
VESFRFISIKVEASRVDDSGILSCEFLINSLIKFLMCRCLVPDFPIFINWLMGVSPSSSEREKCDGH